MPSLLNYLIIFSKGERCGLVEMGGPGMLNNTNKQNKHSTLPILFAVLFSFSEILTQKITP